MKYRSILNAVQNTVWPIMPEKLEAICGFLESAACGVPIDAATVEKIAARNRDQRVSAMAGSVAVLPIYGTISQRMDLMSEVSGGTSTDVLGREFDALMRDPDVSAVVFDIDSPGGNYYGTPELAERIRGARGTKPIVAQVNSLAGSAAYWLATAADSIMVTPSGDVGSVGVLAVHYDMSAANEEAGIQPTYIYSGKYKVEGNPDSPLDDEARGEYQRRVDAAGDVFVAAVAKNRGTTPSNVRSNFGQGRVFAADEGVDRGMADRVQTMQETISRLTSKSRSASARRQKAAAARRRLDLAGLS